MRGPRAVSYRVQPLRYRLILGPSTPKIAQCARTAVYRGAQVPGASRSLGQGLAKRPLLPEQRLSHKRL